MYRQTLGVCTNTKCGVCSPIHARQRALCSAMSPITKHIAGEVAPHSLFHIVCKIPPSFIASSPYNRHISLSFSPPPFRRT